MAIIRKTKTVKLILNTFYKNKDAVSVVELINKFKKQMDKTTVYRILDRLESSGILHSFIGQDGLKRYAKWGDEASSSSNVKVHPHFLCKYCGNSLCLPLKIKIPIIPNYKIDSVEQLLVGKCKNCIS